MSDHADGLKRLSAESLWIAFAGQFGGSSWSFCTGETELDRIGGMSFGASSKDCLWLSKVSVVLPCDAKWDDRNHDQSSYDALLNPSNPRHQEGPPPNWYSEREAQTPILHKNTQIQYNSASAATFAGQAMWGCHCSPTCWSKDFDTLGLGGAQIQSEVKIKHDQVA